MCASLIQCVWDSPQAFATPPATSAKDVIDGKRYLRGLVADALAEYLDTSKGTVMVAAEKLLKAAKTLPEGDELKVNVIHSLTGDMASLKEGAVALQKYDLSIMTVSTFQDEATKFQDKIVAFDSRWDDFKQLVEDADRSVVERKKELRMSTNVAIGCFVGNFGLSGWA